MKLTVINRSPWPTAAIQVIGEWVCQREQISWDYRIIIRNTRRNTWRGRGWTGKQTVMLHRRYKPPGGWPFTHKDHRFQWSKPEVYRSRLELLVMLIAHEAHHATDGRRGNFLFKKGRCNVAGMEYHCNNTAAAAVAAFHDEWPSLRRKIKAGLRRERRRTRPLAKPAIDPSIKAAEMLARWERRLKLAQSKVRKYARRARYYQTRAAAKQPA